MTENNHNTDDFSFDNFISEAGKQELESGQTGVVIAPASDDVKPDDSLQTAEVVDAPSPQTEIPAVETPTEVIPENTDPDHPVRASDEPEWKYNYRLEIYEKQKALKNAPNDAAKQEIKTEMNGIRKELATRSKIETTTEEDPDFESRVKENGYVPQSEIASIVQQQLAYNDQMNVIGKAETDFLARHPEMKNQVKYDNLVSFVGENFILQGKSYNGITTILEMAHDTLYPKNIETKIAKTEALNQKIDAVDFSGSSASDQVDPTKEEGKKLVDDIRKNTGNDFGWAFD